MVTYDFKTADIWLLFMSTTYVTKWWHFKNKTQHNGNWQLRYGQKFQHRKALERFTRRSVTGSEQQSTEGTDCNV